MNTNLVANFPSISEPVTGKVRKAKTAPATVAEYVSMASPAVRAALITERADIPGTLAGLARYERRKHRAEFPEGGKDGAGRWYPSDAEDADEYTKYVRTPSRAWPWSYFKGAFTLDHCLALDDGTRECVSVLRKKVRGVSLADVLVAEPEGQVNLMAELDRAVLRQVVGLAANDNAVAETVRRRVM
jgi:hypothetical protein